MPLETNSVWYGSSDTCQMASLETFKIEEKNKCVLKWLLGKIQCFKPPPPRSGKFHFFVSPFPNQPPATLAQCKLEGGHPKLLLLALM